MRDHSIDFIKGIAIIFVILTHNIFVLGKHPFMGEFFYIFAIAQAVPLFIFITGFYLNKRLSPCKHPIQAQFSIVNLKKLFISIILPAGIVSLLIIVDLLCKHKFSIIKYLKAGFLYGPGSYFPIFYIQFWILAPLMIIFKRKIPNFWIQLLIIIGIEIGIMHCYTLFSLHYWSYRLLFIRQFLVFFLGMSINIEDIYHYVKWRYMPLLLISVIIMYLVWFTSINIGWLYAPYLPFYSPGTAFYTVFFFIIVKKLFDLCQHNQISKKITSIISLFGKHSYTIFLIQLLIFYFEIISRENKYLYIMGTFLFPLSLSLSLFLRYQKNKIKLSIFCWYQKNTLYRECFYFKFIEY